MDTDKLNYVLKRCEEEGIKVITQPNSFTYMREDASRVKAILEEYYLEKMKQESDKK